MQLVEEKADLSLLLGALCWELDFVPPTMSADLPGDRDKLPASATNTIHLYKLPSTHHSLQPDHLFIVYFIAHVGCWILSSRWPVHSKLASPLRGCTDGNVIKRLAKQSLVDHQWFYCWKCHCFGSYKAAGYLKCVICSWYQSQWNYRPWIIYMKNSGSLPSKF